ncbi:MAG: polyhydroxyalkanoate depolymerase [Pseudomonadota bacterium]
MMYHMHDLMRSTLLPMHQWAKTSRMLASNPFNPLSYSYFGRTLEANLELIERQTANYEKPRFGLNYTEIDNEPVAILEEIVADKPYCQLLRFRRDADNLIQPKILMVAPLSGHFATLLRGTVKEFLPDHDVYITDWKNTRDVSLDSGPFHFDDYVKYIIDFMDFLGPETHCIAVCQPAVPVMVAAAVMSDISHPCQPKSITLMGGPIDVRKNPTEVNDYATNRDIEWFKSNVICKVPFRFEGRGQLVYPGFIQLAGFMSMNLDSHLSKHFKFFGDLIKGDGDGTEAHRKFYDEYLSVMDLPAHFYLETIEKVFLNFDLAVGSMHFEGQIIDLGSITKPAFFTIEGENDDITGKGQTKAALELCSGIPDNRKQHYEQPDVGHYGIFNGRRFREEIAPRIKSFITKYDT